MKPNVLVITWHDAGRWFGCYGNPHVHTPHVDRCAAAGVRFANLFSTCSICSPSRASLFTGRHPQRHGVSFLTNKAGDGRIGADCVHLGRLLKGHGYRSVLVGVNHETCHEHAETIAGFDEQLVTDPWPPGPVVADAACAWLGRLGEDPRPFYAEIGLFEAHVPFDFHGCPPDDSRGITLPGYLADTPLTRRTVVGLQGMLRRGDEAVGRILDALRACGRERDTIVVIAVDHGVELPRAKTTMYDPGHAVAAILRWPGGLPAGRTVDVLSSQIDILPTLCGLIGIAAPAGIDGCDLSGHARGEDAREVHEHVFGMFVENRRMVRDRRWKLIRNFRPFELSPVHLKTADVVPAAQAARPGRVELYDLVADPDELHDLSTDPTHAAVSSRLDGVLWDFLLDGEDFVVRTPLRDDWGVATRGDLEAHCRRRGRRAPTATGPRRFTCSVGTMVPDTSAERR